MDKQETQPSRTPWLVAGAAAVLGVTAVVAPNLRRYSWSKRRKTNSLHRIRRV